VPTPLAGRCFVTQLRAGEPLGIGTLRRWGLVGTQTGATHISMRTLEFAPGRAPALLTGDWDDVWYVLAGRGELGLNGSHHDIGPQTGIHLRPGSRAVVDNLGPEPLVVVSCRCPDPGIEVHAEARHEVPTDRDPGPIASARLDRPASRPLVHLSECEPEQTEDDRWFRVLVDTRLGCEQVTQFVGCIPPGRAPDHFHDYEEVLCILEGSGVMWADRTSAPIGAGSCVYLPRGQVHCVENRGAGDLLLLGVFYPAGSPAARRGADAAGAA
jgi:mannose-6-phosphate isomerase-like protein (cupin superfamily)